MRELRRGLVALTMLALFAVPASALSCQTVTFDQSNGPVITSRTGEFPRVALVGHYLVVTLAYETDPSEGQSVEITSDVASATVCDDGSVALEGATPEREVNPDPESDRPIFLVPAIYQAPFIQGPTE